MARSSSSPIWSFFSGAYGLDLGLEAEGLKSDLAVELDSACCATIKENRPDLPLLQRDVRNLTGSELRKITSFEGEVFAMIGGPPCQSFSTGGKRAALNDSRGNLIYEYLRLVREVEPKFFVLENVASIVTAALRHRPIAQRPGKHWSLKKYADGIVRETDAPPLECDELPGSAINQVLSDIKAMGYNASFAVLNSADFGAPQVRMRFVLIGGRGDAFVSLPKATHGPESEAGLPYAVVKDAIADLELNPGPHSSYTPEVRRFFDLIPSGGNWRALPRELQKLALGNSFHAGGGKTGFFRRLSWDAPAPTIVGRANRKGSALCHPTQSRPLSVRECARLQGFPDEWKFAGSMSQQYLQVGNAVPLALGAAVGRALQEAESGANNAAQMRSLGHDEMLRAAVAHLRSKARNKVRSTSVAQKPRKVANA